MKANQLRHAQCGMRSLFLGLLVVGPKSEAVDLEVQFAPRSRRKGLAALFRRD